MQRAYLPVAYSLGHRSWHNFERFLVFSTGGTTVVGVVAFVLVFSLILPIDSDALIFSVSGGRPVLSDFPSGLVEW